MSFPALTSPCRIANGDRKSFHPRVTTGPRTPLLNVVVVFLVSLIARHLQLCIGGTLGAFAGRQPDRWLLSVAARRREDLDVCFLVDLRATAADTSYKVPYGLTPEESAKTLGSKPELALGVGRTPGSAGCIFCRRRYHRLFVFYCRFNGYLFFRTRTSL